MGRFILLLFLIFGLFVSCGTTRIIVDNPNEEIYVNNVKRGTGVATIKRTGTPQKSVIETKNKGVKTNSITVRRRFTFLTGIVGYFTYGVGLIFCWQYPKMININSTNMIDNSGKIKSDWQNPNQSIWMQPIDK